jgi:ArsR family transcriptional regulator, arsenate/arsenite/antimonite-responsive transcriptional repressor
MDEDSILTFRAPAREPGRVDAIVSPVLELAYAAYSVAKRGVPPPPGGATPGWLRRLARESPGPLLGVEGFWRAQGLERASVEAFVLAAHFGHIRDDDPERFLGGLAGLAGRFMAEKGGPDQVEDPEMLDDLRARLERLRDPDTAAAWADALRGLWRLLEPEWDRVGRPAAQAAADAFLATYRASGSVLASLPPHHFVQFEAAAASIRKAESEGRVVVVPLGLAVAGGFHFDAGGALFIGFGLQVERVHERTAERVAELAARMKVFADPTRAMLLALIGRFASLSLTVGDLALQLGVSQPTVSGHLRLLREAGLVRLERRGNKAYHRLDHDAVHGLLADFEAALLVGAGDEDEHDTSGSTDRDLTT